MNVFDFDNTIFEGDSTYRFFRFCLRRHPRVALYLPRIGWAALKYYAFHIGDKTRFKERMYTFLKACRPAEDVDAFWRINLPRIREFYREIHSDSDVIVSASPEFLLKPLEDQLRVTVIASRVSPADGRTTGLNCYHEEKVRRFRERFPDGEIDAFYSDSYSDEPLALLAKTAHIVTDGTITPWDFTRHKKNLRT